jgi:hypothetical protein
MCSSSLPGLSPSAELYEKTEGGILQPFYTIGKYNNNNNKKNEKQINKTIKTKQNNTQIQTKQIKIKQK